jgi:16S rRNA (cytosine967-C5)-methyltransferase
VAGAKLEELRRRARRAGLSNLRAVEVQGDHWPDEIEQLAGKAERVLVDAPCSGVGSLRRNPEARWRLVEEDVQRLPKQQLGIAARASRLVMPGGWLVYATCTVLDAENEAVVKRFLESHRDFERVPLAEALGARAAEVASEDGLALETWPQRHGMDGFYAAVLRRRTT